MVEKENYNKLERVSKTGRRSNKKKKERDRISTSYRAFRTEFDFWIILICYDENASIASILDTIQLDALKNTKKKKETKFSVVR